MARDPRSLPYDLIYFEPAEEPRPGPAEEPRETTTDNDHPEEGVSRVRLFAPRGLRALVRAGVPLPPDLDSALCSAIRTAPGAIPPFVEHPRAEPRWHDSRERGAPMLPAMLTYAVVARELGYASTRSVARLVRQGRLRAVGEGRGRRVPRESLERYLRELRGEDE